jgi:hypothetical protein
MPPPDDASWEQYRRLILAELERINTAVESINRKIEQFRQDDIASIKTDIALLKFQAAMWGAGAGIVFGGLATVTLKFVVH